MRNIQSLLAGFFLTIKYLCWFFIRETKAKLCWFFSFISYVTCLRPMHFIFLFLSVLFFRSSRDAITFTWKLPTKQRKHTRINDIGKIQIALISFFSIKTRFFHHYLKKKPISVFRNFRLHLYIYSNSTKQLFSSRTSIV
jgi:hypothetical protein